MCCFLYGAVNREINIKDYNNAAKDSKYHFSTGSAENINACVKECGEKYRLTAGQCDCDTAIGRGQAEKAELGDFKELILSLRSVRGIKYVLLSKNWWGETNLKQQTVHIDDIDIVPFLANIDNNCLYKIELYPRY